MIALGVYGGADGRAAAIAHDGRLLAAVHVSGSMDVPVPNESIRSTIAACLDAARITADAVDRVVVVDPSASGETVLPSTEVGYSLPGVRADAPATHVQPAVAHASLMRATAHGDTAGLVLATERPTSRGAFVHIRDGALRAFERLDWLDDVAWSLDKTATALGGLNHPPVEYLESLAGGDESTCAECHEVFRFNEPFSIGCDHSALVRYLGAAQAQAPGPLDGSDSHLDVRKARRRVAVGVLNSLADCLADVGQRWCDHVGAASLLQAGSMFESSEFRARIARRHAAARAVPLPQNSASALGAALLPFSSVSMLDSLSLGPSFDEQMIKTVLENCRLVYVYEPNWGRLLALVSTILSSGALVGWFQGRCDFGPRSLGSRSILVDPSIPYARENANVFLLARPIGSALPLTLIPSLSHDVLPDVTTETRVKLPEQYRKVLAGAINTGGTFRVTPPPGDGSLLSSLLELHHTRTAVPGLINVPLADASGQLASAPRDAVRSVFGSAVDMLVIGRFLVSKDHWLIGLAQTRFASTEAPRS
jgi:predicted NodU family carbamoyl transferase